MGAAAALAGRRGELAEVVAVLTGTTGVAGLLVVGEAGVGKSRLVAAAAADAAQAGVTVLLGWCLPRSDGLPFLPVVDLLHGLSAVDEGRLLMSVLRESPAFVRGELGRLVPELAESSEPPDSAEPYEGWRRRRLFEAHGIPPARRREDSGQTTWLSRRDPAN